MKKVLVAGAALLIAGSMVSAASAEVNLSGDARARYIGNSDRNRVYTALPNGTYQESKDGYQDEFDSRIRVKFDAKSPGGAFMKARLRFDDYDYWDGQGWSASRDVVRHNKTGGVWTDYALIGVPIGPTVLSAGRMEASFSKFFSWDGRATRVKLDWKFDNFRLIPLIDVMDENTNAIDNWDDNDMMGYGLVGVAKINDDWSVKAYARYHDDQREYDSVSVTIPVSVSSADQQFYTERDTPPSVTLEEIRPGHYDRSGFLGSIDAQGKVAMVGLHGGIAYKEAAVLSANPNADDGWGWYLEGSLDMGAFSPALVIGGTYDGYQTDPDFGFIMIGADEPITVVTTIGGPASDSIFAALTSTYTLSDRLKFAGNLVYYDIDVNSTEATPDVRGLVDAWEISGSATYVLVDGADLTYKLGYLSPSYDGRLNSAGISDDGYFGNYLRLSVKF